MEKFNLYKEIFHPSWIEPLREAGCLDELDAIISYLDLLYESTTVFPRKAEVFRVFKNDYKNAKVVLLGQDPYHSIHNGHPDACGYSFLTENKYQPPSLKNMFKELCNDVPRAIQTDISNYNFISWVEQGVLMLNTALTVESGKANSHALVWKTWSEKLIAYLVENRKDIVWILLGKQAEKMLQDYECRKVIAAHPSPLAGGKFFGSKIYSKTNDLLTTKIKW